MLKQDYLAVNASTATLVNYENFGNPYERKMHVKIKNVNPDHSIFVGDANVTASGGSLEVPVGGLIEFDLSNDDGLYAISAAGTFQITVIKQYQE